MQRYGLALDGVHYYSDVLRRWIDSREPDGPKRKRIFIIRRDPRDISAVYFFDPELNCYFEIPYRDTSRPALTLWELREARTRLKQQGVTNMDEDLIFQAHRKLRAIEEEATTATRKAHRMPSTGAGTKAEVTPPDADESDDQIRPFEEIEPWP